MRSGPWLVYQPYSALTLTASTNPRPALQPDRPSLQYSARPKPNPARGLGLYRSAADTRKAPAMSKTKLKPHKGLLKRVTITANGKVKFHKCGKGHLNSHMTGDKLRSLGGTGIAKAPDIPRLQQMLHRRLTPGS